ESNEGHAAIVVALELPDQMVPGVYRRRRTRYSRVIPIVAWIVPGVPPLRRSNVTLCAKDIAIAVGSDVHIELQRLWGVLVLIVEVQVIPVVRGRVERRQLFPPERRSPRSVAAQPELHRRAVDRRTASALRVGVRHNRSGATLTRAG